MIPIPTEKINFLNLGHLKKLKTNLSYQKEDHGAKENKIILKMFLL